MKKALIYGLTLTFALTLTACGQPKAEEPGAPDPATSAAVQTASPEESTEPTATPELSEGTPTTPAETDAQPDEDTTQEPPAEDTTPEQTPEAPGEAVSTQPPEETEPASTTKPTTQTTKPSIDQTQAPPIGGGSDFVPGPGMKDPTQDQTGWSEYTPTGGQDLDGVDIGELWKNIQSGGQTQSPSSIGDPVGDLANGNWQISTGNPEWDEILNAGRQEDAGPTIGERPGAIVDDNGNVSNAGLNVQ